MRNKPGRVTYSAFKQREAWGLTFTESPVCMQDLHPPMNESGGSRADSRPRECRELWWPSAPGLLPVPKTPTSPILPWKGATSPFQDMQRHPKAIVLWGSGTWSPKSLLIPVPGSQEVSTLSCPFLSPGARAESC